MKIEKDGLQLTLTILVFDNFPSLQPAAFICRATNLSVTKLFFLLIMLVMAFYSRLMVLRLAKCLIPMAMTPYIVTLVHSSVDQH